jgi:hypothetical protein
VGLQDTQRKVKAVYRLNDYAGVREDPVKSKQTNNLLCSNITKHTSNNGAALDYKIPSPTAYLLHQRSHSDDTQPSPFSAYPASPPNHVNRVSFWCCVLCRFINIIMSSLGINNIFLLYIYRVMWGYRYTRVFFFFIN